MKIKVLGSGSSGNAYLVEMDGVSFLIECGIRWRDLLKRMEFKIPDFCLITHEHCDHSLAVKDVVKSGIPIICTNGTAGALGVSLSQRGSSLMVGTYKADHDAADPSLFLIDSKKGERLFFVTDTFHIDYAVGGITHLMIEANWSAETINPDCAHTHRATESHLSLEKACEWVRNMDKTRLREVHLIHLSSGNAEPEYFKSEMQKAAGVPVYIAANKRH